MRIALSQMFCVNSVIVAAVIKTESGSQGPKRYIRIKRACVVTLLLTPEERYASRASGIGNTAAMGGFVETDPRPLVTNQMPFNALDKNSAFMRVVGA
jgi:hypothetical protein